MALRALGAVLLGLAVGGVGAQESSVRPGINRLYQHPDVDQWEHAFERPGREVYDRRKAVVAALALRPGMVVADVGAGTGLYTGLLARAVGPTGRVYAVDISTNFVRIIERRARAWGLNNVVGIVNTPRRVDLAPGSLDLAFVCDTYHHFEYPQDMLQAVRRALKPGGSLVIIDYRKQPGVSSPWVMSHVRADRATVLQEVHAQGFRRVEQPDFLRQNYLLRFQRP